MISDWTRVADLSEVKAVEPSNNGRITQRSTDYHPEPIVELTRLSDVQPRAVEWLWKDRFPLGMLSVIAGDPNIGKSTVITDMASRISVGRPWPDSRDVPNPAGDVLLCLAEDGIADTVRIRVDNAGGDPSRIHILDGIRYGLETETIGPFALDRHMHNLDWILERRPSIRMVAFDPLDAFLGDSTDSHRKSEVQLVLSGLSHLAERRGVAIVGVMHLRKQSGDKEMYRVLGSLGFVSAPRSVWMVCRDGKDRLRRTMTCIKLNCCPEPTGLAFSIEGAGVIHWESAPVTITSDQALEGEKPKSLSAVDDASDWLLELLALGPVESERVKEAAEQEGLSWASVRRAKTDLRVIARPNGGRWHWRLTEGAQDAQSQNVERLEHLEHLTQGELPIVSESA